MNPLIQRELEKLNTPIVTVAGCRYPVDSIPNDATIISISKTRDTASTTFMANVLYHFIFDKALVKPTDRSFHDKWNAGTAIPLTMMYGNVLEGLSSMIKVELYGSNTKSGFCHHCLRFVDNDVLCADCRDKLGIMKEEDLLNIRWVGWVPIDGIKTVTRCS